MTPVQALILCVSYVAMLLGLAWLLRVPAMRAKPKRPAGVAFVRPLEPRRLAANCTHGEPPNTSTSAPAGQSGAPAERVQ